MIHAGVFGAFRGDFAVGLRRVRRPWCCRALRRGVAGYSGGEASAARCPALCAWAACLLGASIGGTQLLRLRHSGLCDFPGLYDTWCGRSDVVYGVPPRTVGSDINEDQVGFGLNVFGGRGSGLGYDCFIPRHPLARMVLAWMVGCLGVSGATPHWDRLGFDFLSPSGPVRHLLKHLV